MGTPAVTFPSTFGRTWETLHSRSPAWAPFIGPSVVPQAYSKTLVPDGPCAVDLSDPPLRWAGNPGVCGFLSIPSRAAGTSVVRWMVHSDVPDEARCLGLTVRGIEASS